MMYVDINCDLGEGIGNDAALMPLISSCNIACGGHTGNAKSMHDTLLLAHKFGVKVGAHPSFPDRENFGRIELKISLNNLVESIYNQIINLKKEADNLNLSIHHIKPHGALYNLACINKNFSTAIIRAVAKTGLNVYLYAPYKSVLAQQAVAQNLAVITEAFIDRRYQKDGTLVSREQQNAVILEADDVFEQFYSMVVRQELYCVTGEKISIKAKTFCIHGDNPKAVSVLEKLHKKCKEQKIIIN
jgi:5-oxoprolinase (ATP-hydrolysing) subunit A